MVRRLLLAFGLWLLAMGGAVGQEWTFGEVEKLPGTVNSAAEESMPILSPDGKTLYFTRIMCEDNLGGKYAGQDIWVSEFDGRSWSKADNRGVPFNDKKKNNAVVGMSADGKTVYLMDASPHRKIHGIHFSKHINGKWTDPELIPIDGIASNGFIGFYVSPDFDVILISMKGDDSRGEEDLYVCLKDGTGRWSKPRNLGPSINTAGFEISPFLTADKKRLFFSSNGHQGLGDGDIFYCDRLYDSWETWTVPKNLGEKMNSPHFDGYFSILSDSVAYVTSSRGGDLSDLYSIKIIDQESETEKEQENVYSLDEINRIASQKIDPVLLFNSEQSDLTKDQLVVLELIGRVFSTKSEIRLHLMAHRPSDSQNLETYQKRLMNILDYLKSSGIEGSRITLGIEITGDQSMSEKEKVEVLFLKAS